MTVSETFSSIFLAIRYRRARPALPPQAKPRQGGGRLMRRILAVAIPVSASGLVGNLISSANTVLVPQRLMAAGMAQSEAVGALGVVLGMAMPLFMLPMAFIGPLVMVMLPRLSEGCAVGDMADVHRKIGRALHATGLIALPLVAVMAPMGQAVCELLYGQVLPQRCFYLIAAASVFVYYQAVTTGILNGISRQNTAMVNTIIGGAVQLAFTWFAVSNPELGINGYLLGVLAGSAISALLNMDCLIRKVRLRVQWARWFVMPWLAAAACALAAANVWILTAGLHWDSIPAMVWSFAAGMAMCGVSFWVQGIRVWRYLQALLPAGMARTAAFGVNSLYY